MKTDDTPPLEEGLTADEWKILIQQLTDEATKALWWIRKGPANTEETVSSALRTYLRRVDDGWLPPPADPETLWPILQMQLERKIGAAKASQRYKKNSHAVRYSELAAGDGESAPESAFAGSSSPEQVEAYVAEAMELLTQSIDDEALLRVGRMKLECYTTDEIAEATALSTHQVRRRIAQIKALLREGEAGDA